MLQYENTKTLSRPIPPPLELISRLLFYSKRMQKVYLNTECTQNVGDEFMHTMSLNTRHDNYENC